MGATDFTTAVWTEAAMQDAYSHLATEARYEYGSDPYNGSISTTGGARTATSTPMTANGAEIFAAWAMDYHDDNSSRRAPYAANKWGDALAIPLLSDDAFTMTKRTFTLTDDVLGADALDRGESTHWRFRSVALDRAVHEYGHRIHSVDLDVTEKFGITVDRQQGKARTVYEVVGRNQRPSRFDTKAQAVAAAKRALLSTGHSCPGPLEVRAVKSYGTGGETDTPADPTVAVQLRRIVLSARAKVTVTVATPKKRIPAEAKRGWLFYGIAAI